MTISSDHVRFLRRKHRTRTSLAQNQEVPRLSVHRTLRHIYAQIIDDKTGVTLASASDHTLTTKGTKTEIARQVGATVAKLANSKKVTAVRFDRGAFGYHGRVAALAEGARAEGLQF